nr:hypothetical protein [Tanacetum cinerariifolium]
MQTQTSNTLHNVIMEAGSKDRPPMLAPGNYVQWKSIIKRYIDTKPNHELIHYHLENPPYKLDWIDIEVPVSEGRIDNDIYSTVDACSNACEMWKAIKRLKQEDQKLEAHYMYMTQLQEVSPDTADSGPIFDNEPVQKVSNDDHYNVFAMESVHPEQSKSVNDTYPIEQDVQNVIIDSLDMNYNREEIDQNDDDNDLAKEHVQNVIIDSLDMNYNKEEIDQNDDDNDLAKERVLLASLIKKLKCEIDESKNRNKFLETWNEVLIEKLKGEIEDFKNKNKSLESSNNFFKEANNKLSETNNLLYTDYKKSEAEHARCNIKEYASQMELECAKVRGELLSYKMEYQKSCTKYTETITDLNQTILKMKDKLSAHQETISILLKQKEA